MNSCHPKECVLVCLNHDTEKIEVWSLNSKGAKQADGITEGWEIDSRIPMPFGLSITCENDEEYHDLADKLGYFVQSALKLWAKIDDITT